MGLMRFWKLGQFDSLPKEKFGVFQILSTHIDQSEKQNQKTEVTLI